MKRRGPGKDTTSAKAIATAERHAEWLRLRKAGKTYRAIAADQGVTPSTVQEAVVKLVRAVREEPAADLRAFELEALDGLIEEATKALEAPPGVDDDGNVVSVDPLPAIEQLRKLRADRRKMLGLDAPQKVEVSTPPREQQWERVRAWLAEPTAELEQVLAECGWTRKGKNDGNGSGTGDPSERAGGRTDRTSNAVGGADAGRLRRKRKRAAGRTDGARTARRPPSAPKA